MVRVVIAPSRVLYEAMLRLFWESHAVAQCFRQGDAIGTHYRSVILPLPPPSRPLGEKTPRRLPAGLREARYGDIATEILPAESCLFCPTGGRHQQYLDRSKAGYCGIGGTGVKLSDPAAGGSCPTGIMPTE